MSSNTLKSISPFFYRRFFGSRRLDLVPDFLNISKKSYDDFIQVDPETRNPNKGLEYVFQKNIYLNDPKGNFYLKYLRYEIKEPKISIEECKLQGITYAYSLSIICHVIFYDKDAKNKDKKIVIEDTETKIHVGEIPKMCHDGSFIINGISKAVITQIQRIPGVFFVSEAKRKKKKIGYQNYVGKIIPYYGSWIEFFVEGKDVMYFRLDKKKKIPVSTLLMSLSRNNTYTLENENDPGFTTKELLSNFYDIFQCEIDENDYIKRPIYEFDYNNYNFKHAVYEENKNNILIEANHMIALNNEIKNGTIVWMHKDDYQLLYAADDIFVQSNGNIIKESAHPIHKEDIDEMIKNGIKKFEILNVSNNPQNLIIINTFIEEDCDSKEEAYSRIIKGLKINETSGIQSTSLYQLFIDTFFNDENYNLSEIGRITLNERLGIDVDQQRHYLCNKDIIFTIKKFCEVIKNDGPMDDIDSLENKRLRLLGENFSNQCLVGVKKMIRSMKDRLFMGESFYNRIKEVISGKILLYPLKKLLNVGVISQFEEQTNKISSLMHQRRLVYQAISGTIGGGGKSYKRRIEAARDNHQSFYGKICPFSTPEGHSLGYVNSLSIFAAVDEYGILKTPYYTVNNGKVNSNEVVYLSAGEERKTVIASFNDLEDENGELVIKKNLLIGRKDCDFAAVRKEEVEYAEVSADQILSVSAGLIPFCECNDAFRVLMAANMIKQAVPLIRPSPAIVSTGLESLVTKEDYNGSLVSPCDGEIIAVDNTRVIILETSTNKLHVKDFTRFSCSNQNTIYGFKAIVKVGDKVAKNDIIADSECSVNGELSLGNNALVAFIPCAECFEDSIWVSSKYAYDDKLTSHHITVFEVQIRDSRVGHEIITRDIPGISQDKLKHLDEEGIIMEGVKVSFSMILVGKVTPRSTHQFIPDQKLLHTIFGEKSSEVSDTSFRAPAGTDGIVTKVEIIRRSGIEDDERLMAIEMKKIKDIQKNAYNKLSLLEKHIKSKILEHIQGKKILEEFVDFENNKIINERDCERMMNDPIKYSLYRLFMIPLSLDHRKVVDEYEKLFYSQKKEIEEICDTKIKNAKAGRELPAGVLKIVRIHVMEERDIQQGDKITGRHGNKGVISKIANPEDMPYLANGKIIDIVMNPIGVKARMNLGVLMESVTGMACVAIVEKLKKIITTPNYSQEDLDIFLKRVGLNIDTMNAEEKENFFKNITLGNFMYTVAVQPFNKPNDKILDDLLLAGDKRIDGCEPVYDGKTGELLGDICTGYQYILKLCHMAKDKIHSRFTGPYSFITQQPLCGKSNNGGQRLGEMELWALEAYGVPYTIQEMVTIKSDAVRSRYKAAESIVNGESLYRNVDKPLTLTILEKILASGGISMHLEYDKNTEEKDIMSYINKSLINEEVNNEKSNEKPMETSDLFAEINNM